MDFRYFSRFLKISFLGSKVLRMCFRLSSFLFALVAFLIYLLFWLMPKASIIPLFTTISIDFSTPTSSAYFRRDFLSNLGLKSFGLVSIFWVRSVVVVGKLASGITSGTSSVLLMSECRQVLRCFDRVRLLLSTLVHP